MKVECVLLFGGKSQYDKKDKSTGKKTGEKSYIYNFLEVDSERNFVNAKSYFNDEDLDISKLELLKPCKVVFEISPMSDFKRFVTVNPVR